LFYGLQSEINVDDDDDDDDDDAWREILTEDSLVSHMTSKNKSVMKEL